MMKAALILEMTQSLDNPLVICHFWFAGCRGETAAWGQSTSFEVAESIAKLSTGYRRGAQLYWLKWPYHKGHRRK